AAYWIVFPGERGAGLRRLTVHIRQQAMHAQPVLVSGDREHRGAEIIEALIHPLGGLQYPPPTVEVGLQLVCHESPRSGSPAEPEFQRNDVDALQAVCLCFASRPRIIYHVLVTCTSYGRLWRLP